MIETEDVSVPYEVSFKCKDMVTPNRTGKGIWRKPGAESGSLGSPSAPYSPFVWPWAGCLVPLPGHQFLHL